MKLSCYWILILQGLQEISSSLQESNFKTTDDLQDVISISVMDSISQLVKIFDARKLSIWHSDDQIHDITKILKNVKIPFILNAAEIPLVEGLEKRRPSDMVIIFSKTKVQDVINNTLWTASTLFLFFPDDIDQIKTEFSVFWKNKVINAYAMIEEEENITIYGFDPYSKGQCGEEKIVVMEKYSKNTGKFENGGLALGDPVKIKTMNQCPVNITIVDVKPITIFDRELGRNGSSTLKGIEGYLMQEVARIFDFNVTFRMALDGVGWGWIRPSPQGAVGEVYTGKSDFANGLLAPTVERCENLDLSLFYGEKECITYGVPSGGGVSTPNWITILIFEFTPLTWALLILTFIVIFYVFFYVNKYAKIKWFTRKSDIFLYEFSSFLGLPIKIPDYLFTRLTVVTWILFSFVTTLAYKSSMGSKLTVPSQDPDINTFEELLKSHLQLTGYKNMLRILQYNENETVINKMAERFKITDFDINYAMELIARERKIAYMRHTSTFLYHSLINTSKRQIQIHVMTDCILTYFPIIATKKNSPFSYRLNQLISRLLESGITQLWRSKYIYTIPSPTKPFHKLSIYHMYGVFCILLFGCFIGTVIFLTEIAFFRCGKSKGSQKEFKKKFMSKLQ